LVEKGLTREKAYELVQRAAKRTWDEMIPFLDAVSQNSEILHLLSQEEINETFDTKYHTKNISKILKRAGVL